MSNWAGRKLGNVQIESLIARGGVAEIYIGTHLTLDRKVAVKILRNMSGDNSDALFRFQREARVVAKLRHPNIVQVYDFDAVDNDPYLVMEYIEGPSLSKYLNALHQKNERMPLTYVDRLLNAVASALQYAHNNGVVHRDIKPGNILLTAATAPVLAGEPLPEDFEPVLTDFGLVRFLDANRETTTGHIAGTPAYMSPEQARGETTDGRTDVYSLGIVLYELLAGHIPFDGETTVGILLKQVNDPPPPIPGLSPFLESVLNHALAKDVKDRFQTPTEFANAFRAALQMDAEPSTVELDSLQINIPPVVVEEPVSKPVALAPRRQPTWLVIALLGLIVIAVGGILFANALPTSAPVTQGVTSTLPISTSTLTLLPESRTGTQPASLPGAPAGPSGILRFENGNALADKASLIVQAMPAPPAGSQYEAWLTGADNRVSLGILSQDASGQTKLEYTDPAGSNLLAKYDTIEITIEPQSDSDPKASGLVAYSFSLPAEALRHLRYLLVTFPGTPTKSALMQGLYGDMLRINTLVKEMRDALEKQDKATGLAKAEDALILLAGVKSSDYKDWNGDGKILSRTESYGLQVNGNSFGYIQAVSAEAEYTVNIPNATQSMVTNGGIVKTCAQNLSQWAPQLRDLLVTILTSSSDAAVSAAVKDAVLVADQMLNGIDVDGNGEIDTVSGECGAQLAYEYTYYMADMPILPVSVSYQLTVVANPSFTVATKTRDGSQSTNPVVNTPKPKPTQKPRPAKTDNPNKPTKAP